MDLSGTMVVNDLRLKQRHGPLTLTGRAEERKKTTNWLPKILLNWRNIPQLPTGPDLFHEADYHMMVVKKIASVCRIFEEPFFRWFWSSAQRVLTWAIDEIHRKGVPRTDQFTSPFLKRLQMLSGSIFKFHVSMHYVVCVRLRHAQNECVEWTPTTTRNTRCSHSCRSWPSRWQRRHILNPRIVSVRSLKSEVKNQKSCHATEHHRNFLTGLTDLDLLNDRNHKTTKDNNPVQKNIVCVCVWSHSK